jgi:hypothetical protein
MKFSELAIDDTFDFTNIVGYETWSKTSRNEARRVNSRETRRVDDTERVSLIMSTTERSEAIRRNRSR